MLDREFQIAVAQSPDEVAGTFAGNAAGHRAAGTPGGEEFWKLEVGDEKLEKDEEQELKQRGNQERNEEQKEERT